MSAVRVVEVVRESNINSEEAVHRAVEEAVESLRNMRGVAVVCRTSRIQNGKVTEYRATCHVAFEVEHHPHIAGAGAKNE